MERILSENDEQIMISSFLEIAERETAAMARHFLKATSWKLEEALQLFFISNDEGGSSSAARAQQSSSALRAPLPIRRETLCDDDPMLSFFQEEMRRPSRVWESNEEEDGAVSATTESSRYGLASLFRFPSHLIFAGPFDRAKIAASAEDRWLLVNIQSTKEFSSHMLNRDTWANELVSETVRTNFIFWQIYDDTTEGRKARTYYKLDLIPAVLVIDPITGQKNRVWSGMVEPETLLEGLLPFLDAGPKDHLARGRSSNCSSQPKITDRHERRSDEEGDEQVLVLPSSRFPALPEEPIGDKDSVCRVGVRLPNGRRVQRNFLRADPIQLLWSFCSTTLLMEEDDDEMTKEFQLRVSVPGASEVLDYESNATIEESGLADDIHDLGGNESMIHWRASNVWWVFA